MRCYIFEQAFCVIIEDRFKLSFKTPYKTFWEVFVEIVDNPPSLIKTSLEFNRDDLVGVKGATIGGSVVFEDLQPLPVYRYPSDVNAMFLRVLKEHALTIYQCVVDYER